MNIRHLYNAYAVAWVFLFCGGVGFAAAPYLPLQQSPADTANPYGLDATALIDIDPGNYRHTRWGVWQDGIEIRKAAKGVKPSDFAPQSSFKPSDMTSAGTQLTLTGERFSTTLPEWASKLGADEIGAALAKSPGASSFDMRPRVLMGFDASSVEPTPDRFFLLRSLTQLQPVDLPSDTVWYRTGWMGRPSGLVRFPSGGLDGSLYLYRRLNFSLAIRDADGTQLDASGKRLVVLVHGWNPDRIADAYGSGAFKNLKAAISAAISGSDWRLVPYHWEPDAATGPRTMEGLKAGIINASEAAQIGHAHGVHLGARLMAQCANLEEVHIIAHSAGAWVARSAAKSLLNRAPKIRVQVTLLDPFVPGAVDSASAQTSTLMDDLAKLDRSNLVQLENYHTVDLFADLFAAKVSEWSNLGQGNMPTALRFNWGGSSDHQEELARTVIEEGTYANSTPAVVTGAYAKHGGAIQFYAGSITGNAKGKTSGWGLSLFAQGAMIAPTTSSDSAHTSLPPSFREWIASLGVSWEGDANIPDFGSDKHLYSWWVSGDFDGNGLDDFAALVRVTGYKKSGSRGSGPYPSNVICAARQISSGKFAFKVIDDEYPADALNIAEAGFEFEPYDGDFQPGRKMIRLRYPTISAVCFEKSSKAYPWTSSGFTSYWTSD